MNTRRAGRMEELALHFTVKPVQMIAEALAHACCVTEWLNRHPMRSSPDRCLWCGQAERSHGLLVPFGTEAAGHAWLHHRCWEGWHARRKTEATDALTAMGIRKRSSKA